MANIASELSSMFFFNCEITEFSRRSVEEKKVESKPVAGHPLPNLKWQLLVYPKGDRAAAQGHVSMYLRLFDEYNEIKECNSLRVSYRIGIVNANNIVVREEEGEDNFMESNHKAWGWSCYIKRGLLETEQLTPNDTLTLRCEITYSEELINQMLSLTGSAGPYSTMALQYSELYKERNSGDVTFQLGKKKLIAHKLILSCRSDVFKAMLEADLKENRTGVVEIEDFDFDVMDALVYFIYTGLIPPLNAIALDLMKAADKYNLPYLKEYCEKYLCTNLPIATPSDALPVLTEAIMLRTHNLKRKVTEYIKNNFDAVKTSISWVQMMPNPVLAACVTEIIEQFRGLDENNLAPPHRVYGSLDLHNQ